MAYMFVTYDLSVVKHISDHIAVVYLGQLVEKCSTKELFSNTLHPYTRALLSAISVVDIHKPMARIPMKGEITSPINPKPGCRFASRCPCATEACRQPQKLEEVSPNPFGPGPMGYQKPGEKPKEPPKGPPKAPGGPSRPMCATPCSTATPWSRRTRTQAPASTTPTPGGWHIRSARCGTGCSPTAVRTAKDRRSL